MPTSKFALTLAIVLVGLAGRAAVDKVLALRGGAELVAYWGQLGSAVEVVAGVALAGVGTGLAVMVAQAANPAQQQRLLRDALAIGLAVALPVAIAVAAGTQLAGAGGGGFPREVLWIGAAAGWLAIVPGTVSNFWLGQQRRGSILALAAASSALTLLFCGTLVRIASWIPLYALYAMHRTRAIAVGELLSLPLFAAILWAAGDALTLELAGAAWLACYLAYGAFNLWAAGLPGRRLTS